MSETTMRFIDGHGREATRTVKLTINIEDYRGLAGYPVLVLAANPHLSIASVSRILDLASITTPGAYRPESWLRRRRKWYFLPQGAVGVGGRKSNADGQDGRAFKIMGENSRLSSRKLVALLQTNGIVRSREWVRSARV